MDTQPLVTRWSEVESWLHAEAGEVTRRRTLPASAALAFHGGQLSTVVETPTFCVEDAELITDELCRFLPQLHADQLLVIWPGAYELDEGDGTLWVMRATLGDRDHGWRTLLYPLPFDGRDVINGPVEIDPIDPYTARIRGLFDVPVPPIHDSTLITPFDDRFAVYFHSDGRYASSTPLFGFN
jgi:hypothetical protein